MIHIYIVISKVTYLCLILLNLTLDFYKYIFHSCLKLEIGHTLHNSDNTSKF